MSKKCFVCGKKLGLMTAKAKTADGKYLCANDANHFFGTDMQDNNISFALTRGIHKMTSQDIIHEITEYNIAEEKEQKEREDELNGYRYMNLASVASKIPGINLKKNEYAYYAYNQDVSWLEERSKTSRINYGGLTGTIHIAKGLNYRLGSIKTDIEHETYLKQIFNGIAILTNKRIILVNQQGVKAYPFTRLLSAIPFEDGVVLCSESGKKVILEGFDDAVPFNIVLDRVLNEDNILPGN